MTSRVYVPPAWKKLDLASLKGTLMVIGASDTGKTTFARYLVGRLAEEHGRVGLLDLDMGQSTLGVPTTMNAAIYRDAASADGKWQRIASYFVGSISPRGHMLPTVVGAHRLHQKASTFGVAVTVIDTTGLVTKRAGGGALKHWKIELLRPGTVVALQREGELEHILHPLRDDGRLALLKLPVSGHVSPKDRETRRHNRQRRFVRYFRGADTLALDLEGLAVFGADAITHGRLVAFQDQEGFALGLGVTDRYQSAIQHLVVRTPFSRLKRVRSIRVGSLEIDPTTGEELAVRRT